MCGGDSIQTILAIFIFESWSYSKERAEIITLETFVFISVKLFSQLQLGMLSGDSNSNIRHTLVIEIAVMFSNLWHTAIIQLFFA